MLIDKYKQLIQEFYEKPAEKVIIASLILNEFADDFSDMESETNISNAPKSKKRKKENQTTISI